MLTFFAMIHRLALMRHLMLCLIFMLVGACSSSPFFATFKPLLAGLDESGMTAAARSALAEARFDFERARKDHPPHYARLIRHDTEAGSKCYQGRGYTLTVFDASGPRRRVGQRIEVDVSITGGDVFRYDESYERWD